VHFLDKRSALCTGIVCFKPYQIDPSANIKVRTEGIPGLQVAVVDLEYTIIKAPFSGFIEDIYDISLELSFDIF